MRRHPNVHLDLSGIPPKKLLEYLPRLEEIADKLKAAGSERRDDINQALGVGGRQAHGNVEVKYSGPDAIMLDVSETGWIGTPSFGA